MLLFKEYLMARTHLPTVCRQRLLFPYLDFQRSILDIGIGDGRFWCPVAGKVSTLYGADLFESLGFTTGAARLEMLRRACPAAGIIIGSVLPLPFTDQTFDQVVCSEVLEHVRNWRRALAEISRVLKKGGQAFITLPSANDQARLRDKIGHVAEEFDLNSFNKWRLAPLGLAIKVKRYWRSKLTSHLIAVFYKTKNNRWLRFIISPFSKMLLRLSFRQRAVSGIFLVLEKRI